MTRKVEPLCTCPVGVTSRPQLMGGVMGGGQRPGREHRVGCQVYRAAWGMPARPIEVGDRVLIDGIEVIVTGLSKFTADGIGDYVRAPGDA